MAYYFFQCQKCSIKINPADIEHDNKESTIYCKDCRAERVDPINVNIIPSVPDPNLELQELRRKNSELENTLKIQEHHQTVIRQRNNEQVELIKKLREEKAKDLERTRVLEKEIGRLNGEIESFKMRRSQSIQRIRSLTDELKKERLKVNSGLGGGMGGLRGKPVVSDHLLKQENQKLKNEIEGMKSQNRLAEENLNSVLSSMGSNQGPLSELMKKLQEATRRKEMLEQAVKTFQKGRKEMNATFQKRVAELENNNRIEKEKLDGERKMMERKIVELENRLLQARSVVGGGEEVNMLKKRVEDVLKEKQQLMYAIAQMRQKSQEDKELIQKTLAKAEDEKAEATSTHVQLCKILKDMKSELEKLRVENQRLKGM